jgi:microcystin-dependent protein
MVLKKRTTLPLALAASIALALPAAASAGGDAPPVNPSVVNVPILRTQTAIDNAANAIDGGQGATAAGPLRASRRYLIRSYKGAKYLIANAPPPPVDDARASRRYSRLARRFIRASRRGSSSSWIGARSSQFAGPVFADAPTAVFSVFGSQYSAATASVGMLPDVKGNLLNRVKTTLNTAIVLRNRLVKIIALAAPPAPADDASVHAHASQEEDAATTFDLVMPSVSVLLADEIQQMQATQQDTSVPAASSAVLTNAIAADQQIKLRVDTLWPPVVDD